MSEALTELAAVRSEDPDFVLAGVLQAFGFAAQLQNSKALETANELISREPQAPVFYNVRGYLHVLFGDSALAAADFETALDKDPDFHPASFNLARLAIKAGDKNAAKARLQSVLAHSPNQPQALVYLASMLSAEGDDDAAEDLWQQARANNPTAIEPRILLARYYRKHNNLINAKSMANEAYALAPYSPAAQFEYAGMKINAGDPADALPAVNSLVERYPNSVQGLELLAQVYNLMGDAAALESTLVSIVEKFPDALRAHVSLGRLYVGRDEYEAAEKIGDRLIVNDDPAIQAQGYIFLGDVKVAQKKMVAALAAFRKAHDLLPNTRSMLRMDSIKR